MAAPFLFVLSKIPLSPALPKSGFPQQIKAYLFVIRRAMNFRCGELLQGSGLFAGEGANSFFP